MNKTSRLLILSIAVLPLAAMAETYKCRAPNGKISYSGQMSSTPGVKCEPMFVKKAPVTRIEAPPSAESAQDKGAIPPPDDDTADPAIAAEAKAKAEGKTEGKTEGKAKADAPKTAADKELEAKRKKAGDEANQKTNNGKQAELNKQAELKKMKEENCRNSKANYQVYLQGGRIRKTSESGEISYYTEDEIKQNMEQAKQEVDKWCGS